MTEDDLSFLPLRVTRVGVGGKRSFDPIDKRRLVEACLRPGTSLSGLALKAGVNANQLHKWVRVHEQGGAPVRREAPAVLSAFVPVVTIEGATPVMAPAAHRVTTAESSCVSPLSARPARLMAHLPNGVKLELECSADDVAIVNAMIVALGAR
jgi:transposase